MVTFDELRISEDGNCLIIELRIEDYDVYRDMYIQTVDLEYYKNRDPNGGPSDKALNLYTDTIPVSDIRGEPTEHKRHMRFHVNLDEASRAFQISEFRRQMFYVYVECGGQYHPDQYTIACGFDNTHDVAVIIDWLALYEKIMPLVAKYASSCNGCDLPADFETMILLWNAFRFAVDVCDYAQIEHIWEELMGLETAGHIAAGCGCGA